ncbi:MAG: hypothetical protein ACI9K1_002166 [Arcticibacterium sp.]
MVYLQVSPDEFFSYENGIHVAGKDFTDWRYLNLNTPTDGTSSTNYRRDTEISIHFDYLESKKSVVSQKIGLKIYGGWTRALEQKAFWLYARDAYGKDEINQKFFKDTKLDKSKRFF